MFCIPEQMQELLPACFERLLWCTALGFILWVAFSISRRSPPSFPLGILAGSSLFAYKLAELVDRQILTQTPLHHQKEAVKPLND